MDVQCGVCLKSESVTLLDSRLKLYKCRDCNHTVTAHPTHDPELYSAYYYSQAHKNWFKHPNFSLFSYLNQTLRRLADGKNLNLLDVGCGNGDFLKYLAKKNPAWRLYGVDTVENEYLGVRFFRQDFFQYEPEIKFEAAVTLTVIEHIEDGHLFLEKIRACLRPGGLLAVTTNNNDGLFYKIARGLNKIGFHAAHDRIYSSHHVQHFTNTSLRLLLERHGFQILVIKNHNYPLKAVDTPPANLLMRTLYGIAVAVIFFLSGIFGNGFLQTCVCRKAFDRD